MRAKSLVPDKAYAKIERWERMSRGNRNAKRQRSLIGGIGVDIFPSLRRYADNMVGIAQLVRAPDCDSGGRRFKSGYSPFIEAYSI